jgi:hypothetical protein
MVYRVLKDRLERGELSTEIGDAAPAHHTESPRPTGPRAAKGQPARTPERAVPPAQASRPTPPAPTQRAAPEVEPLADAPAEGEFEFDDHVDLVLREVDGPAGAGAPAKPAPASSKPAAPPSRKGREPVTAATPGRRPTEPAGAKAHPKSSPRMPAPSAPRADAPTDENLFAAIPESPFDLELGRLPALDEASIASESAREEGPDEFVTDPMRRSEPKPAPSAAAPVAPAPAPRAPAPVAPAPRAPERPREARDAREVELRPARPAADAHSTQEIREVRVAVPLVLTRAQLEGGAPIRVVLDVKIIDE